MQISAFEILNQNYPNNVKCPNFFCSKNQNILYQLIDKENFQIFQGVNYSKIVQNSSSCQFCDKNKKYTFDNGLIFQFMNETPFIKELIEYSKYSALEKDKL